MPQRGYVLIFVFWALLAVLTPTLVFWSASARPSMYVREEERLEMVKARRMMGSSETGLPKKRGLPSTEVEAPAPAPVPAPVPGGGNGTV